LDEAAAGKPLALALRAGGGDAGAASNDVIRGVIATALALHDGRVELGDGALAVSGQAPWEANVEYLQDDARGLAERAGVTLRWEVARDVTSPLPGMGWLIGRGGEDTVGMALKPVGGGEAVTVAEGWRVPVGLYALPSGKILGVQEGRRTWYDPRVTASVRVGGLEVPLDDDVPFVGLDDPGTLSYETPSVQKQMEPLGSPGFGVRRIGDRAWEPPTEPSSLPHWVGVIHTMLLHTSLTQTAAESQRAMVARGLSEHFIIDFDGTIYQTVDVARMAFHAAEQNNSSVGVTLISAQPNLVREPDAPPFDPNHARAAEMAKHPRARSAVMRINGGRVQSYGYTDAQRRSLGALARALASVFPKVGHGVPRDARGEIITAVVEDPDALEGVVGHWHTSADRWDPGPGMDWRALEVAMTDGPDAAPTQPAAPSPGDEPAGTEAPAP
ncbi:MAG: N-acetylmuramoyl-L-alanine amidase, partial [Myxococcales bacterium]|nr:N-acetylmuramoyl-L-alanine amidase [Myxococcales bacterium]